MDRERKTVKASDVYSRRLNNKEDNGKKIKADAVSTLKNHSLNTGMKSVDIKSVKANVQEATEKVTSKDKDEIKQLSNEIIGAEAVALAELNSVKATERGTENLVKGVRYTVTRFSKENQQRRNENKEYNNNRKEIGKINKEIKEIDREISRMNNAAKESKKEAGKEGKKEAGKESEKEAGKESEKRERNSQFQEKKDKYKKRQDNLRKKKEELKGRNRAIRKRKTAERHTRSVNIIKQRAGGAARSAGKDIIRTPNRFTLMLAGDLEADKLVMTTSAGILHYISKMFGNIMKLIINSIKSILFALSPMLLISAFLVFMIYIMFLSDFNSYFDIGIEKNMISSEEPEDVGSIITTYIINRRKEMAKEIVDNDSSVQVYFVKLDNNVVDESSTYIGEKAKELDTPTLLLDEWIHSDEADIILEDLADKICYRLTEEEASGYSEESLEAYEGNIAPEQPEPSTEPETESTEKPSNGEIGIGGGLGIGIGSGISKPEQPEPETEQSEQQIKKAVIGYHSLNETQ